ncbi:MAG: glycosyltransferase [Planctomycetota bacterium]
MHCFNMMRSLMDAGNAVTLLTDRQVDPQLATELHKAEFRTLEDQEWKVDTSSESVKLVGLQKRFANYWGADQKRLQTFALAVNKISADVLVCVGPLGPLMATSVLADSEYYRKTPPTTVWYAADDLALLHLTLARRGESLANLKRAFTMAMYERAFCKRLDAVWVVSESDAKALSIFSGSSRVAIVRNGVDLDYFAPLNVAFPSVEADEYSCVFWGALDFAPNRDAVCWFVRHVWPGVRRINRDAKFRILGLRPPDEIKRMDGSDGITVKANVPDLRPEIARNQIAVFPFISGAGIKNKVLESAALGLASIGSGRAFNGLVPKHQVPMIRANHSSSWQAELHRLWCDQQARRENGRSLREWVTANHSWPSAAKSAERSIRPDGDGATQIESTTATIS